MNANQPQYNYQAPPPMPPRQPAIRPRTKNKFFTFVFACIPGAGQMYHGLMKKGVSLMVLFWGLAGLSLATYMTVLTVLLPVIWFYSFFDTVNRMNMSLDELRVQEDCFLFGLDGVETSKGFRQLFRDRHLILGWGLIIAACWMMLNGFFNSYWGRQFWGNLLSERLWEVLSGFVDMLPALIVPTICIVIGLRLIKGDRKKSPYNEYTIPRAEPPISPERPAPMPTSILEPGPMPKAPAIDELFDMDDMEPEGSPRA